jgi:hypothetical protein
MLIRPGSLSGQRTTLSSSVVVISDLGPLSGCGYIPTLTSSEVACVCNHVQRMKSKKGQA